MLIQDQYSKCYLFEMMRNMFIYKILLFSLSVICLPLSLLAQQPDAQNILDRTAENFRNAGGVKVTFTVRTSEGNSLGTIRMKGEKFLLEAEGTTTWFDGRTQWSYLSSSGEVNISEPTSEELQTINPYALLSLYKHGYKLKLGKIDNSQDQSLYKIVLTATNRKQDLQCIILYVTKDSLRPVRVSMAQRGGETAVVIINSYQSGLTYQEQLFVFDKKSYPEAEVIDLR